MKKTIISISIIAVCIMAFFMTSSFKTISSSSISKAPALDGAGSVRIFGTYDHVIGSTYYGTVVASGAINATGTYVMPAEVLGNALHCIFELTFPTGTITIRMNCNMVTLNGRWQILSGTGAYQNLKGGGSLTMPGDDEELIGSVRRN